MEKTTVIFDLDGTLALVDHRRHFVEGKGSKATKEDWHNFYAACVDDQPNVPVIAALRALESAYEIIIFSGRSDEVRFETERWLERHKIAYDDLLMRPAGSYKPDEKLKQEWLDAMDKDSILCVFDDRDKVVAMWRSNGITCFQVAPGNF